MWFTTSSGRCYEKTALTCVCVFWFMSEIKRTPFFLVHLTLRPSEFQRGHLKVSVWEEVLHLYMENFLPMNNIPFFSLVFAQNDSCEQVFPNWNTGTRLQQFEALQIQLHPTGASSEEHRLPQRWHQQNCKFITKEEYFHVLMDEMVVTHKSSRYTSLSSSARCSLHFGHKL